MVIRLATELLSSHEDTAEAGLIRTPQARLQALDHVATLTLTATTPLSRTADPATHLPPDPRLDADLPWIRAHLTPLVRAAADLRGDAARQRGRLSLNELPLSRAPAVPPRVTDPLEVLVSAAAWVRQTAFEAAHAMPANGSSLPLLAVITRQICGHAADVYARLYATPSRQPSGTGWWTGQRNLLLETAAAHRNAGQAWLMVIQSWASDIRPLDRPSGEGASQADALYAATASTSGAETLWGLLHDRETVRHLTVVLSRALTELADAAGYGMRAMIALRANGGLAARNPDARQSWKICGKDIVPPVSYITLLARYARAEQATLTAATHATTTAKRTGAPAARPSLLHHVSMGSDLPSLADLLDVTAPRDQDLRRTTALDVLAVLAEERADTSGPTIANRSGHNPTTVYRILTRLEQAGWVESWLSPAPGPRRRFYRLHPERVRTARALIAETRRSGPPPPSGPRQLSDDHAPARKRTR